MVRAASPLIAPESTSETRHFGDLERLAGQVGLVHAAAAFDDGAVDRADLVGEDDDVVAEDELAESTSSDLHADDAMGTVRHAFGKRGEDGGGAAGGVVLEGGAAGEHEDDDGAGEVFAEEDGRRMEMPARRSEPNSRAMILRLRS